MKILKIIEYIIPLHGNKRIFPYGKLEVSDGKIQKVVNIKLDFIKNYFTFNRRRYYIKNMGSLYNPNYVISN